MSAKYSVTTGLTLLFFLLIPCARVRAADVPPADAQLYGELNHRLDEAEVWLRLQGRERRRDTVFMTELLTANSNSGARLLDPHTLVSCGLALDRLHELGIRGVKISIQVPMLLPIWNTVHPQQPNTAFIEFYRRVGEEVRRRGMALAIQLFTFFPNPSVSHDGWNYHGMTVEQLAQDFTAQAQVVLREVRPDTLVIFTEPTTQQGNTGLDIDPETELSIVQAVIRGCPRSRTKLAAGAGTWDNPRYFELLASRTSLDVIDMHVYTTADGEMTARIEAVEDLCRRFHKEIAMSECWLYKSASPHPGENGHQSQRLEALSAWSFWEPLDERFVRDMVRVSRLYGLKYCSFFPGLDYFLANLQYGPSTSSLTPNEILQQEHQAAAAAMRADTFAELGLDLAQLLR